MPKENFEFASEILQQFASDEDALKAHATRDKLRYKKAMSKRNKMGGVDFHQQVSESLNRLTKLAGGTRDAHMEAASIHASLGGIYGKNDAASASAKARKHHKIAWAYHIRKYQGF